MGGALTRTQLDLIFIRVNWEGPVGADAKDVPAKPAETGASSPDATRATSSVSARPHSMGQTPDVRSTRSQRPRTTHARSTGCLA